MIRVPWHFFRCPCGVGAYAPTYAQMYKHMYTCTGKVTGNVISYKITTCRVPVCGITSQCSISDQHIYRWIGSATVRVSDICLIFSDKYFKCMLNSKICLNPDVGKLWPPGLPCAARERSCTVIKFLWSLTCYAKLYKCH